MKKSIICLSLSVGLLMSGLYVKAQTDSRNRTIETVIQDGLAQLPSQQPKEFRQVMAEMSATGSDGLRMLIGMLVPAEKGNDATVQYAIDGITSLVSEEQYSSFKPSVLKGLREGFSGCQDSADRAFLLTQIQKIASSADASFFASQLNDAYLRPFAVSALAAISGTEDCIRGLIKSAVAPDAALASLACQKHMKDMESILLNWYPQSSGDIRKTIINALTTCGGAQSVQMLYRSSKAINFQYEPTGVTEGLLRLLENCEDASIVLPIARKLTSCKQLSVRCAALRILLEKDSQNAVSIVHAALKDKNRQYRVTALDNAPRVAGDAIFSQVTARKYSNETLVDIVRWLGENKKQEEIQTISEAIRQTSDSILSVAGIEAAGRVGGNIALSLLIWQLGTQYSAQAEKALASFPGDIMPSILKSIGESRGQALIAAFHLASLRRMHSAYESIRHYAVATDGVTPDEQKEARKALIGVASSDNFDDLCGLMEAGDTSGYFQRAACQAISSMSPASQYECVTRRMNESAQPSLYYTLLAQAASKDAIDRLYTEYRSGKHSDKARKALLQVGSSNIIPVFYEMVEKDGDKKDDLISRYIGRVRSSSLNPVVKYQHYAHILKAQPSDAQVNLALRALENCHIQPALMLASQYLDSKETAFRAANAVKTILSKSTEPLREGAANKLILEKALEVFKAQTNNADAGYAVDEIEGQLLPQFKEIGYIQAKAVKKDGALILAEDGQNVEFYMDWKAESACTLSLRSIPQIILDKEVGMLGTTSRTHAHTGKWNTLHVRMTNDRLHVDNNGIVIVDNYVMKNAPKRGAICIVESKNIEVRNLYLCTLPDTPEYRLSSEEEKEGFELLFDGHSLEKWQGNLVDYVPVDGYIHVSAKYGGSGNLYTRKTYSDFIYRFEFCFAEPGVNNGVGIRTHIGTDAAYDGMEIQVLDHDDPIYKGLHPYQQHGAVYGIIVPKHVRFGKIGTWNTEEIRAVGDHITVTVNGEVILDGNIREACQGHAVAPDGGKVNPYTVDKKNHPGLFNKEGYISFCGHGPGVKFRNIRIKDLSAMSKKK